MQTASIDAKAIETTMLSVVADKTGYPTDMLGTKHGYGSGLRY